MNCTPIVRHHLTIGGAVFLTKYTVDEKSNAVLEYLKGKKIYKSIAKKEIGVLPSEKMGRSLSKTWDGRTCLKSYTNYTLPFKLEVLKYMNE